MLNTTFSTEMSSDGRLPRPASDWVVSFTYARFKWRCGRTTTYGNVNDKMKKSLL